MANKGNKTAEKDCLTKSQKCPYFLRYRNTDNNDSIGNSSSSDISLSPNSPVFYRKRRFKTRHQKNKILCSRRNKMKRYFNKSLTQNNNKKIVTLPKKHEKHFTMDNETPVIMKDEDIKNITINKNMDIKTLLLTSIIQETEAILDRVFDDMVQCYEDEDFPQADISIDLVGDDSFFVDNMFNLNITGEIYSQSFIDE